MYPQTQDEIKDTNRNLAIGYGVAMVVAYIVGFGAMIPGMVNSFVKGFEEIREPRALVGAGENLYIIERLHRIGKIFDSKDDREVINISYKTEDGWAEGPAIDAGEKFVPLGNSLLVFTDETMLVIEGDTVRGEYPYPPRASSEAGSSPGDTIEVDSPEGLEDYYNAVSHMGGVAILEMPSYDFLRLSFLNSELEEEWSFDVDVPIEVGEDDGSYYGSIYSVCSNGEDLYLYASGHDNLVTWKIDIENKALGPMSAETLEDEGYYYGSSLSNAADRTIFFYDSRKDPVKEKKISYRFMELSPDGKWTELPELKFPPKKAAFEFVQKAMVTEQEGRLQFASIGTRSLWMELADGEWKDRSDELPKTFGLPVNNMFGSVFSNMNASMQYGNLITSLVPALFGLIAHFHFLSRKNPRVIMGENAGELASMGRRTMAFGIDMSFFLVPMVIATWYVTKRLPDMHDARDMAFPQSSFYGVIMLATFAEMVLPPLYFIASEAIWGRSLGKAIMGIRVVMADGSKLTGMAAVIRNALRLVDMMAYYIPVIVSVAATQKYQRIGDIIGKTVVVRDRKGKYMERLGEEELRMERERQAAEQARGVPPGYPPFGPGPYPGAPPGVYYSQITGPASPPGPALPDEPPPLPTPEGGDGTEGEGQP